MTSRHALLKRLSAAAGSLLLAITSAPAAYGPRLIIGDVYQQSSNTTSINAIDPAPCQTRVNCYVLFQPVPNQKQVVIEQISCWILTSDSASTSIASVYLWSRKGTESQFHQSYVVPMKTGVNNFAASGTVLHPLDVNERPFIAIWNDGAATMDPRCTISGRIVPAQ